MPMYCNFIVALMPMISVFNYFFPVGTYPKYNHEK